MLRLAILVLSIFLAMPVQAKELSDSAKVALAVPASALLYSGYIKDYEGMAQLGYTFLSV